MTTTTYRFPRDEDFSYLTGLLLACNAVPDVRLLVDGPDCTAKKIELVDWNHDLSGSLVDAQGAHRLSHSGVRFDTVELDRSGALQERLVALAELDGTAAVWLAAMPMAAVTGLQYDRVARRAAQDTGCPTMALPTRALQTDWLGGYAAALEGLAESLPLSKGPLEDDAVGVVGYFFDRHEGEHLANLKLLERSIGSLGLRLTATWLDGGGIDSLASIGQAATLLSLPYATAAAERLAQRTGARVVELPLPIGVGGSDAFLRALGRAVDREDRAVALAAEWRAEVLPALERLAPVFLVDRPIAVLADRYLGPALAGALEEFGVDVTQLVLFGSPDERLPECSELDATPGQVCVGNSYATRIIRSPVRYVHYGFPAGGQHYLLPRPTWFPRGFLGLVEQLINAQQSQQVLEDSRSG